MSVTRQEPPSGGSGHAVRRNDAAGQPAARQAQRCDVPFDFFLEILCIDAKARNDTEWLEWYEGWLKNMPEDGREDYIERSRVDYEGRTGETIAEYFDRKLDERINRRIDRSLDERIDRRARRNIEEAMNKQIMVDNFRDFEREYIGMAIRRSC